MTDVALKEYLESQIAALRREVESWRDADQTALRLALDVIRLQREGDMEARQLAGHTLDTKLDGMNLFRAQILEERQSYIRIDLFEAYKREIGKDLELLNEARAQDKGRRQVIVVVAAALGSAATWVLGKIAGFIR